MTARATIPMIAILPIRPGMKPGRRVIGYCSRTTPDGKVTYFEIVKPRRLNRHGAGRKITTAAQGQLL